MQRTRVFRIIMLLFFIFAAVAVRVSAQEAPKGPPPARVVVSSVERGHIAPSSYFIGTTYFVHSSELASEVTGRVDSISFEEGDEVSADLLLAVVDTDLLDRDIQAKEAEHQQIAAQIAKTRSDLERIQQVLKKGGVSAQLYDEAYYRKEELESRANQVKAELDRLRVQKRKASITPPFAGVVVERGVEVGEWVSPGSKIATVADNSMVDVRVSVPQTILPFIKEGLTITVKNGSESHSGTLNAIIPKGDVLTRTVPVYVRLEGGKWIEGLEAQVALPTGERREALIVPRDAVLRISGQYRIYTVADGKAESIPVRIVGYEGATAGVEAEGLEAGMQVVIKGNERLRPGQPVIILNGEKE